MTIPFLGLFKKLTGRAAVAEEPAKPAPRVIRPKKADSERLSKTVMPNATRSLSSSAPDPFRSAATVATPRSSMPLELGASKITTAAPPRPRASQLPPALARALEPKIERTISLRVADLVDFVPAGFIKPVEILDTNATVLLKASEIEKGMPDKHPTISLPSLYQQVPEIFLRSVRPDDDSRVDLPYDKVLEQFHGVQVRADQERDPTVPHVDTPILKATIEDSQRFGTKIAPVETSLAPATPVKPATARSIADAEPDATPATPATPKPAVKTTPSGHSVISLHSSESTPSDDISDLDDLDEDEIPSEDLSPNGTGASASERVPASSGPPVPTPLPFTPDLPKIAFQLPREMPVTKEPDKEPALPTPEPSGGLKLPAFPAEKKSEPAKPEPSAGLKLSSFAVEKKPEPAKSEPSAGLKLSSFAAEKKPASPTTEPSAGLKLSAFAPEKKPAPPTAEPSAGLKLSDFAAEKKPSPSTAEPSAGLKLSGFTVEKKPVPATRLTPLADEPSANIVPPEPVTKSAEPVKVAPPEPVKPVPAPSIQPPEVKPEPAIDEPTISFSLKTVLQNLPAFQLAGDVATVANDEQFTLPLKLIEPQLATGRVSIAADVFQKALPEKHRGLFQVDEDKTPVALPLEEVLKNLPATVLKLRDDQEAIAIDRDFETPFFLKAKEDAARFARKSEPEQKAEATPAAATAEPAPKPVVENVDPKEIVAQANGLAGVKACAITFSDGLSLAGELPEDVQADGLCAMAPSMLERIAQHVSETKLGELVAMTLHAKNSSISFFARGNVCLTALHSKALEPEVRKGLAELIEKLSKTYAQPETPNVDH